MFDFGEDLTVDSYRVPWLIWIQILVLFLLILLLFSFTNFSFDLSEQASPSSALDGSSGKLPFRSRSAFASCLQVGGSQSIKGEVTTSTSRGILIVEEALQREDSALAEVSLTNIFHPCFYFRLARTAFLKCLGLDPSDHSSPSEHRKES